MTLKLLESWRRIRSSFWFLPSFMVVGTTALAFTSLWFDRAFETAGREPAGWWIDTNIESARSLLSTLAGSMMTVAGVTFSVVIVALTLASSQYGPRLLARFMEDTGNQVVLGTFISVFMYCIVVLLHLPGEAQVGLFPRGSVMIAVALAVLAIGVLIYFFHHISTSIQAGGLIREAGNALDAAINANLPEVASSREEPGPPPEDSEAKAELEAPQGGYIRKFDVDRLVKIAEREDCQLFVSVKVGDFVLEGQALAQIVPPEALTEEVGESICAAFVVVQTKEDGDDVCLAIERLTEIAVRGLSPGINDPYTAVAALERLTSALDKILERLPAASVFKGEQGTARVFAPSLVAEELFTIALGPLRTYGRRDVRVLEAMVDGLSLLVRRGRPRWRGLLCEQIELVLETSRASLTLPSEKTRIETVCTKALG